MIPSTGGAFEVVVDDDLVYSKKATGEFPDEALLLATLKNR
jgi:selT/selW/selH-like putative selenoprotein